MIIQILPLYNCTFEERCKYFYLKLSDTFVQIANKNSLKNWSKNTCKFPEKFVYDYGKFGDDGMFIQNVTFVW